MRPRPIKKLRLSKPSVSTSSFAETLSTQPISQSPESALFRSAKTLGVVADSVPVSVSRLGSEHFVTASAGNSFLVYDTESLHVSYISAPLTDKVTALLSVGEGTITASGKSIYIWNKMIQVASLSGHTKPVSILSSIGGVLLLSAADNEVCIWDLPRVSRDTKPLVESTIQPVLSLDTGFKVTSVTSIPTYVNKMLIGGSEGELQLWNIRSGKMVYDFTQLIKQTESTFSEEKCTLVYSVSSLCPSPALDVVAVGTSSGRIHLINLKAVEILFSLDQSPQGSVTCMTFRGDLTSDSMLVTGSTSSAIVLWDLKNKKPHSIIASAHAGLEISSITCLDNLPLMVSSGADNSIMMWIFDKPDGGCRMLRERRGFTGTIAQMKVYGDNEVLVASNSSRTVGYESYGQVGKISLIQNQQNQVWSQNNLTKHTAGEDSRMPWKFKGLENLPDVTGMAFSTIRHFDWPAVVTCHKGLNEAYIWSAHQACLVNRMLIIPNKATDPFYNHKNAKNAKAGVLKAVQEAMGYKQQELMAKIDTSAVEEVNGTREVSSVAVSVCGNYAVVGLDDGTVHKFNLQSCLYRGQIAKLASRVRQIEFLTGKNLVAVTNDGIFKLPLNPKKQFNPILLKSLRSKAVGSIAMSGFFCAVALRTGGVSVVDLVNDREVRQIKTKVPINSMCWSNDGRLLFAADGISNGLVLEFAGNFIRDRLKFKSPVVSCCFAANDAHLLTSHIHSAETGTVHAYQNLQILDSQRPSCPKSAVCIDVMTSSVSSKIASADSIEDGPVSEMLDLEKAITNFDKPLADTILTLSDVSKTQLQALLNLDEIKERNTFEKAVTKPKEVPFFLPTVVKQGKTVFAEASEDNTSFFTGAVTLSSVPAREKSRAVELVSQAEQLLSEQDYMGLFNHLKQQTSAGVYLCLAELDGELIPSAVKFFNHLVDLGIHADLVQTWLAVYLKIHGEDLIGVEGVDKLAEAVRLRDQKMNVLANKVLCFSKVVGAVQLLC